jgi:hypothetical protein
MTNNTKLKTIAIIMTLLYAILVTCTIVYGTCTTDCKIFIILWLTILTFAVDVIAYNVIKLNKDLKS